MASIYAVGVILQGITAFMVPQIRISDMLLPLSIIFGWPGIIGLSLGTIVANITSPYAGPVEVGGGTLANLIACYVAWKIGSQKFRGSWVTSIIIQNIIITIIVGSYLSFLLGLPLEVTLTSVFLGSFVAMNIVGYLLLKAVHIRLKSSKNS